MTDTAPLTKTKVGPGTYTNATITVDEYGRITYAAPGKSLNNQILVDAPLTVSATFPQQIGITAASTKNLGVVQLDDSVSSDATDKAATANSVKKAYEEASQARLAISLLTSGVATAKTEAKKAADDVAAIVPLTKTLQNNLTDVKQVAVQTRREVELLNFVLDKKLDTTSFTAKGTLLVGTGNGTFVALPVGNPGEVLTADPEQISGMKWVKPALKTGEGLVGGPISIEGEISLSKTGILAGEYLNPVLTIDVYGRIISAVDGILGGESYDSNLKVSQLSRMVEKLTKKITELERKVNQ
jgi:hypothetical protein